jgi:hypothetical protein
MPTSGLPADVFVHPTASVEDGASVGPGTKIWSHVQVRAGARVGANCILGRNSFVDVDVVVGDNVKVQNNSSLSEGVSLEPGATYFYRIVSEGASAATTVWPSVEHPPARIVVPKADLETPAVDGVIISPQADGTALVTWTTDEPADGIVELRALSTGSDPGGSDREARGDHGLTEHTVVLTGLEPGRYYLAKVSSTDAAGNRSGGLQRVFRASDAGVAEYMAASQRVGELTGTTIIEDKAAVGHIVLVDGAVSGTFTSRVFDARQMVNWYRCSGTRVATQSWCWASGAATPQFPIRVGVTDSQLTHRKARSTSRRSTFNSAWSSWTHPIRQAPSTR